MHGYAFDKFSLSLYAGGCPSNRVSPIRKFIFWYQLQGQPIIIADPPNQSKRIPAADGLLLGFMADPELNLAPSSRKTYLRVLNGFFEFLSMQRSAGEQASFSAQTITTYLTAKRLSAFTYNLYLSCLKQLAEWVIKTQEQHKLTANQLKDLQTITRLKGNRVGRDYHKDSLTGTERDHFLATIDNPHDRLMMALMAWGGLRTIEIVRLQFNDIDLKRKRIWVLGKGMSTKRAIQVPMVCLPLIEAYFRLFPASKQTSAEPLFDQLSTRSIRYRVQKYLLLSGLQRARLSAHSLRHTAAQRLLDEGVDPVHVQRHLRHKNFETTLIYVRKKTDEDYFESIR
ncbi:site-specific integrase [Spirosoma agri]|uniref:Tyrosine-type recombinase/integrase n=1 Tax=Spirosoma agri TaxID=1987381 RepID=A0A6M0ISV7_9BACT|nr:tyrosine-type recombinase/integrase [Spirosoma agri]NEU70661.1 tyrosine-type recombinase/integrase [Spirosoma agri]